LEGGGFGRISLYMWENSTEKKHRRGIKGMNSMGQNKSREGTPLLIVEQQRGIRSWNFPHSV